MPVSHLSDQVVIGLGLDGCTVNECFDDGNIDERSAVFVGCIEDCYIHVDFDNDGNDDKLVFQKQFEGGIFPNTKHRDKDMSGSLIYATKSKLFRVRSLIIAQNHHDHQPLITYTCLFEIILLYDFLHLPRK